MGLQGNVSRSLQIVDDDDDDDDDASCLHRHRQAEKEVAPVTRDTHTSME